MEHIFPRFVPQKNIGSAANAAGRSMSMHFRLYIFLLSLILIITLGVFGAFIMTGQLTSSRGEVERFSEKEFSDAFQRLIKETGETSIQLVSLSQVLARNLEYSLSSRQIPAGGLAERPDALEEILENELIYLQFALERSSCSGVFMILDATVNPDLPNAGNSRAGLHIRNAEPNVPGAIDTSWNYIRGFPGIAYRNGLLLQRKWDMEFDVEGSAFFHLLMEEGRMSGLPPSKLYYWSIESIISEPEQSMLICSIPIIGPGGNVFGVCGFEISQWNFNRNFMPDDTTYNDVFFMFGPVEGDSLAVERAFISGNPSATGPLRGGGPLSLPVSGGLPLYRSDDGKTYYGRHEEIRMLSADSPFAAPQFYASLLLPRDIIDTLIYLRNFQLISICALLMLVGIFASIYAGRRYLNPIISAFDSIRAGNLDGVKTQIVEIDSLIDTVRQQRSKGGAFSDNLFESTFSRIRTLTPIERAVLRCYIEGLAEKEILSILFVSMGAVSAHNANICAKLGLSSKDDLMLYVELIKMSGLADKITQTGG